jgi:23S rRNA pseudouridine955/2504/2580 synthase
MLSKALRLIYNQGGTLAVLKQSQGMEDYTAPTLFQSAIEASRGDKGMASGILNALLGYCCRTAAAAGYDEKKDDGGGGGGARIMAKNLMEAYDRHGDALQPDLVALALAYVATSSSSSSSGRHNNNNNNNNNADYLADNEETAKDYLRRAEQVHGGDYRPTTIDDDAPEPKSTTTTTTTTTIDWSMLERSHDVRLLQEDEEFVVVSKPSGMVCYHPSSSFSSSSSQQNNNNSKKKQKQKKKDISLEDCLLQAGVPLSTLNKEGRGMVHRIDRGTSGCMVLAKTNHMHAVLMTHFFLRNVSKSYQALVVSSSTTTKLLKQGGGGVGGSVDLDIDGRPAKSNYRVEKQFLNSGIARIKVETEQGRRHQVRIHCSQGLQAPILLDPLYGGQVVMSSSSSKLHHLESSSSSLRKLRAAKRFCLHADRLSIPEQGIDVEAPLPEWWQELEEDLMRFKK